MEQLVVNRTKNMTMPDGRQAELVEMPLRSIGVRAYSPLISLCRFAADFDVRPMPQVMLELCDQQLLSGMESSDAIWIFEPATEGAPYELRKISHSSVRNVTPRDRETSNHMYGPDQKVVMMRGRLKAMAA